VSRFFAVRRLRLGEGKIDHANDPVRLKTPIDSRVRQAALDKLGA
jgi:hypothetical protein